MESYRGYQIVGKLGDAAAGTYAFSGVQDADGTELGKYPSPAAAKKAIDEAIAAAPDCGDGLIDPRD